MKEVKKLRAKMLGNVKGPSKFSDGDKASGRVHPLGVILGAVTEIQRKADPADGTRFHTLLLGNFEGQPASGGDVLRSTTCELPSGVHEEIAKAVGTARIGETTGFAVELGTRHAKTEAGYEFVHKLTAPPEIYDPLDAVRAALASKGKDAKPASKK